MPTTVTIQTPAGPLAIAAGKPTSLVAGQTVTIVVAPGVPVESVNFNNTAGPRPLPLGPVNWATQAPWSYVWTVPPVGTPVLLQVELRAHHAQAEPPVAYPITIVATAAKPSAPPVAHDNKPAEVGVPVPVQGTPIVSPWPNGFGACFNFRDGPAWVNRGLSIGVTHFRSFAETVTPGGGIFPRDAFAPAKAILDACPTAKLVGMHGPAEPCPTPGPTVDDFSRFFTVLRPKLVGYEGRYSVELFNELNAPHYLSLSKASGTVQPAVVNYVVAVAAAARKALGPDVMVIGPSIGYLVDPAPQLAWTQALHDAGLQQYVNVWNTHVYPDTLANLVTTLAGVRAIIGPTMPLAFTEISWSRLAKSDWPTRAPMYRKAVQSVNAMPCAYRLLPAGNDLDDRALFHADGTPDPVIQAAWGVGAQAQ